MRTIERTPYGERLFAARQHAKLSQPALAKLVGMAQSNISHLEKRGDGSLHTVAIAAATGVRAEWLATGEGPMLAAPSERRPPAVNQAIAEYVVPSGSRDYRTMVHSLAAALGESKHAQLSIPEFLALADSLFEKLGDN